MDAQACDRHGLDQESGAPGRQVWALALGLFLFALLLRVIYLNEVWSIPFFEHPLVDAKSYDDWARRIAAGDWVGEGVFYQAPGYPYFLAIVYGVVGGDPWRAHLAQMVLGAASCVLMFLAVRRLFDRDTGIVAGLLLAIYPPAIFFDGLIQKAGLGLFLLTLLLLLIARLIDRPGVARAMACGAAVGVLALVRENALVFAAVLPVWILLGLRAYAPPLRLRWAAGVILGLALVLVPVGLRNLVMGGTFALTTSQMGTNFYMGNQPGATGSYLPLIPGRQTPVFEGSDARLLAEQAEGRELTAGEVSRYWLGRSFEYMSEHPGEWMALTGWKALLALNATELPDTEDVYVYAEQSRVLRGLLPLWHFGALAALAAGGAFLARGRGARVWLLALMAAAFWASTFFFYVFARYRFPLVPLLLPLSAFGLVEGVRAFRDDRAVGWAQLAAAVVLGGVVANLPLVDREPLKLASYTNWGHVLLQQGRLDEAEHYFGAALAVDSENGDLEMHLAVLRLEQERLKDAESHARRAIRIEPTDHRPHVLLARILVAQGRPGEAKAHRRRAAWLAPRRAQPGSSERTK